MVENIVGAISIVKTDVVWKEKVSCTKKVIFYDFGGIIKITADILIIWNSNKINLRVLQNNLMEILEWCKMADIFSR